MFVQNEEKKKGQDNAVCEGIPRPFHTAAVCPDDNMHELQVFCCIKNRCNCKNIVTYIV